MRSFLLGLVLLLPFGAFGQQAPRWTLLPDSPLHPYRHDDVFFLDPDHGWVVGGVGVYRTTDGGVSWEMTADPGPDLYRSTGFVSTEKGWIGALFGPIQLYETVNGGFTLTDITERIQPAIGGGICGLWVVNDQVAYGVGQYLGPAYVIKTTDGGQSWTSTDLTAYVDTLVDVYFFDEDRGLAIGGVGTWPNTDPRVIETVDGGSTWTVRHTSTSIGNSWGWKFTFPTPLIGFASIEFSANPNDGYVLKTTDGGETWTEVLVQGGGSMQGTGFLTPAIGWTSGRDTTSVTTDGGQTWQQIDLDPHINRFRFLGDSLGYAVGSQVYILDMRPVSIENEASTARTYLESVTPNPASGPVSIIYRLERPGRARILIYDVLGRIMVELDEGVKSAGRHVAVWEPHVESRFRSSGTYTVQLLTETGAWAKVVTLVRL